MEELRGRIEIVPDPELMLRKIGKKHHMAAVPAGLFLIVTGIWWLLTNMKILPRAVFGPGIAILLGFCCLAKAGMRRKEW